MWVCSQLEMLKSFVVECTPWFRFALTSLYVGYSPIGCWKWICERQTRWERFSFVFVTFDDPEENRVKTSAETSSTFWRVSIVSESLSGVLAFDKPTRLKRALQRPQNCEVIIWFELFCPRHLQTIHMTRQKPVKFYFYHLFHWLNAVTARPACDTAVRSYQQKYAIRFIPSWNLRSETNISG